MGKISLRLNSDPLLQHIRSKVALAPETKPQELSPALLFLSHSLSHSHAAAEQINIRKLKISIFGNAPHSVAGLWVSALTLSFPGAAFDFPLPHPYFNVHFHLHFHSHFHFYAHFHMLSARTFPLATCYLRDRSM